MSDYTLTFNSEGGDCYKSSGTFDNTSTTLYITDNNSGVDHHTRFWTPFTVDIARGTTIVSAILKIVAQSGGVGTTSINLGCEASDNVTNPVDFSDLGGRAKTSATANQSISSWVNGTTYSWDVTAAVQEIINRSGWGKGNRLAIIGDDNLDLDSKHHDAYAYESGANKPILEIVFRQFTPQSVMMFL